MASTTFQNYFRLYAKLSGMTGTADTEAFELRQIYGLDVVVIPTHREIARKDYNDLIFMNEADKFNAVIDDIKTERDKGRPVLVGTASVEASERISKALDKVGISHNVLNAKQHGREAQVIAEAGRPGTVTIATNMAGRGTDIVLGGSWENEVQQLDNPTEEQIEQIKADWHQRHDAVIQAGGLHIIGTERHESRRIDNQLRGRSGRQGDPGSSRFFLSMDDPLMRIFMPPKMRGLMQSLGMKEGEAIEAKMVTNAIEKAQRKVENRNFDIRKQLLDYDNVANDQRQVVYQQRDELMESADITDVIDSIRADIVQATISVFVPPQSLVEQWDIPGLEQEVAKEFGVQLPIQSWLDADDHLHEVALKERILQAVADQYAQKEAVVGAETLRQFEKNIMLQVLDQHWKEHLYNMDHLRQGIHLRGYAQKNPKQEYKRESFELFRSMLEQVKADTIKVLSHVKVRSAEDAALEERQKREAAMARMRFEHAPTEGIAENGSQQPAEKPVNKPKPVVRPSQKVGRNDPCPCDSGKKYKHCHGKLT